MSPYGPKADEPSRQATFRHRYRDVSSTPRMALLTAALGLFVALTGGHPALAQRQPAAPAALQAEFRTFLAGFRQALRSNDAAAVAAQTRLPMIFDGAARDRAYFERRIYRQMFTARNRECLQRARPVYQRDGEGTDGFSLFCGDVIFLFTKKDDGFRFAETGVND